MRLASDPMGLARQERGPVLLPGGAERGVLAVLVDQQYDGAEDFRPLDQCRVGRPD